MKIHSVTMSGFGPFLETSHVDFDAFADDGLFLIAGRTGAGKSSILDALTYGLFGSVARYDGRPDPHVRSRYLPAGERTSVTVEFTVADTRYRIERSPAYLRPKLRGEGYVEEKSAIELARLTDGRVEVFETKVGNADTHVSDLIGMNADQFLQVVLLAQGRFQEFLVAQSEERRKLLRTLFRTERFERYAESVQERARAAKASVEKAQTELATLTATFASQAGLDDAPDGAAAATWSAEAVAEHAAVAAQARQEAEQAGAARTNAEADLQRARTTADRQRRRSEALARQHELAAEHDAVEKDRDSVAVAHRAAAASHAVTVHRAAEARHRAAQESLAGLPPSDDDAAATRERCESLEHRLAALATALQAEQRVPQLREAAQDAARARDDLDRESVELAADRDDARRRLTAVTTELDQLGDAGARHAATQAVVTQLRERLAVAHRAVDEAAELSEAQHEHVRRVEASHTAERHWLDLRRRQLSGWSAAVATDLVAGEPCPVCGSVDHPRPATSQEALVDDSAVEAAEAALSEARQRESSAQAAVAAAEATHTASLAAADGSVEVVTEALADAEEALGAAAETLAHRSALTAERKDLEARIEAATAALTTAAERRERAGAAARAAEETLASAQAVVAEARGDAESVHAVHEQTRHERDAARARFAALEELARCADQLDEATVALTAALTDAGFADAAAVEAARLPANEIERLTALVRGHDAAVAAVTTILAEPELADLPVDPVDLQTPTEAAATARETHETAAAVCTQAETRLESLRALAEQIGGTIDRAADQLARYEAVRDLDQALRGYGANELGMPLETFALAAELGDILDAANTRLATMTHGRYQLQHSEARTSRKSRAGLELLVLDAHSGDARSPRSLSGGEKFQASLALALGLAEVVTSRAGGLRLDTLFIDEGFGTLDPDTLETTMETLDSLREGGRTIGLISHVEAMKEQIPAQLRVEVTDAGWSRIAG